MHESFKKHRPLGLSMNGQHTGYVQMLCCAVLYLFFFDIEVESECWNTYLIDRQLGNLQDLCTVQ